MAAVAGFPCPSPSMSSYQVVSPLTAGSSSSQWSPFGTWPGVGWHWYSAE